MTPPDCKRFWHGFHHQPTRYKTARMEQPREARPAARKIASIFAARKYSSSIYQHISTTSIRRSSTLQWRTPLKCHGYYNWSPREPTSPICRRSSKRQSTTRDTWCQRESRAEQWRFQQTVLATWTRNRSVKKQLSQTSDSNRIEARRKDTNDNSGPFTPNQVICDQGSGATGYTLQKWHIFLETIWIPKRKFKRSRWPIWPSAWSFSST